MDIHWCLQLGFVFLMWNWDLVKRSEPQRPVFEVRAFSFDVTKSACVVRTTGCLGFSRLPGTTSNNNELFRELIAFTSSPDNGTVVLKVACIHDLLWLWHGFDWYSIASVQRVCRYKSYIQLIPGDVTVFPVRPENYKESKSYSS